MKIDFLSRINKLWNVSFTFRSYKKLFPAASAISALVLWPFLLASLLLSGFYYLYAFILKICSVPVDFLSKVMHEEGREVKHATQAIVYFVAFPVVFFMYILISFFTINLVVLYFFISVFNYAWTIKGFVLKPYLLEAECEELPEGRATLAENIKAGVFGYISNELNFLGLVTLVVGLILLAQYPEVGIGLSIGGGSLLAFTHLFVLIIYLAGISVKGLTAEIKQKLVKEEKIEEVKEIVEEVKEEVKVVETPKKPKEKPEFLKRTNIKRNKLGDKLNLIGIIGGGVAAFFVVIGLVLSFVERGFYNTDYQNLCVWDQLLYGEAANTAGGTFGLSCVINALIAFVLVAGASVAVLLLSLLLKPKTNKGTLIRNLIIFVVIVGLTGFSGWVVNICAIESVETGLLEMSFNLLSVSVYVAEVVLTWKIVETVLGYFNVLKIYDRDEEPVLEETTSEEIAEETAE
jgi:hypothetical protein